MGRNPARDANDKAKSEMQEAINKVIADNLPRRRGPHIGPSHRRHRPESAVMLYRSASRLERLAACWAV
jgi:hypothetical protein